MIESLRDTLQPLTKMMAAPFMKIHPNILSILGIFVFFPGLYFYAKGDALLGSLFVIGALFDAVDGTVARATGKSSQFGGVLDATIDRFTEGLTLMAIGIGGLVDWWILFLAFNFSICVSYIKAKAEAASGTTKVGKNQFSVGIGQRGDRIGLLFIGSILAGISGDNNALEIAVILILLTTGITLVWRGSAIYSVLKSSK